MPNQEHERERDQTHSYWYIPSALRVNYSLLIMESARMMKMATGEGSPLRQGARTGSRFTFGGYRGLRRRNSRSILFFGSFRVRGYIWVKEVRGWTPGLSTGQGARPKGVGEPHHPRGQPGTPLVSFQYSVGFFWSKNKFRGVSGQLDSVWFSFSSKP